MRFGERKTSIARLRFAARDRDRIAARLELERLLASADLQPAGLPERSILCVNKIATTQPVHSSRFSTDVAWQRALRGSVAEIAAQAVRLSLINTASAANAVVFGSWAELMACLACDWSAGIVADRWWWRAILRNGESFWTTWRRNSKYIPAALEHLARAHKAVEVVARFTEAEAFELTTRLINTFGLRALAEISEFRQQPTGDVSPGAEPRAELEARPGHPRSAKPLDFAPWLKHVPEAAAHELSREQQRFLGIALMSQRAPSIVRTREFAREVEQWSEQIETRAAYRSIAARTNKNKPLVGPTTVTRTSGLSSRDVLPASRPVSPTDKGDVSRINAAKEFAVEASTSTIKHESVQSVVARAAADGHVLPEPARPFAEQISSPSSHPTAPVVSSPPGVTLSDLDALESRGSNAETSAISVETDLGGLFYLINLALYLNLYGDFTSPLATEIEMNIWDFVALVGNELVDDPRADDPIWSLLASLAGRDATQMAGGNFQPESEWRLPPDWLSPFRKNDRLYQWNASRGRLRVLHPEGFFILDVPLAKNARAQLQHEIGPYGIRTVSVARARLPRLALLRSKITRPESRRWLSLLMPYVRARLRLALGLEKEHEAAAILCSHHARVHASDTHVDVYFELADLPLAIRFAGLDRDPGWVPAAGRFIAFHFQ